MSDAALGLPTVGSDHLEGGRAYSSRPREAPATMSRASLIVKALRLPLFVASAVPAALAASAAGRFSWALLAQALAGLVIVQAAINLLMDFYDIRLGRRGLNLDTAFPLGPVLYERLGVSPRSIGRAAAALLLAALAIGAALQLEVGGYMIPVYAALGLAAALAYILPPLSLARRGVGEPMTFLAFGPLGALGTYYVLTRGFSAGLLLASTGTGGLTAALRFLHHSPENPPEGLRDRTLVGIYSAMVLASLAALLAYRPDPLQAVPWALAAWHLLRVGSEARRGGALAASRLTWQSTLLLVVAAAAAIAPWHVLAAA